MNLGRLRQGNQDLSDATELAPRWTSDGNLSLVSKDSSAKDFKGDPLVWSECFSIYISIYQRLHGETHPDVVVQMMSFATYVLRQAQFYKASSVIEFALKKLANSLTQPHSVAAWSIASPEWEKGYFTSATLKGVKEYAAPKDDSKRKRSHPSGTEPCRNFNEGRCNRKVCGRRHVCITCEGNHPEIICMEGAGPAKKQG